MITKSTPLLRWDTQANTFMVPLEKKLPKYTAQIGRKILPIIATYAQVTPEDLMNPSTTTEEMKMFHSIYVGLMWEAYENVRKIDLALILNRPLPYISKCLKLFVRASNNYESKDAPYRFALKNIKWKIKEFDLQKKEQEEQAITLKLAQRKLVAKKPLVTVTDSFSSSLNKQLSSIHLVNKSEWEAFASVVEVSIFTNLLFETIKKVLRVSKEEMQAKNSLRKIVFARMMFSVIVHNTYSFAVPFYHIGQLLGDKEHSTVMYYINEHKSYIQSDNDKAEAKHVKYKLDLNLLEREFLAVLKEKFHL